MAHISHAGFDRFIGRQQCSHEDNKPITTNASILREHSMRSLHGASQPPEIFLAVCARVNGVKRIGSVTGDVYWSSTLQHLNLRPPCLSFPLHHGPVYLKPLTLLDKVY